MTSSFYCPQETCQFAPVWREKISCSIDESWYRKEGCNFVFLAVCKRRTRLPTVILCRIGGGSGERRAISCLALIFEGGEKKRQKSQIHVPPPFPFFTFFVGPKYHIAPLWYAEREEGYKEIPRAVVGFSMHAALLLLFFPSLTSSSCFTCVQEEAPTTTTAHRVHAIGHSYGSDRRG